MNMNVMNYEIAARLEREREREMRLAAAGLLDKVEYGKPQSLAKSRRKPRIIAFILSLFA